MQKLTFSISLGMALLLFAKAGNAAGWGDVTGTFVLKGTPTTNTINLTKDKAFCLGKQKDFADDSLVIGPDGGIRDIAVYIYVKSTGPKPPVHPDYAKSAKDEVVLDNLGCRFQPKMAMLRTTQTLLLSNTDAVSHNTKIDCFTNAGINPLLPPGAKLPHKDFTAPERLPATISCSIHPWMKARLIIKDHPYMAVTDKDGKFTIKNVPAGEWTFQFYHDKTGYVQKVIEGGAPKKWLAGRKKLTINDGKTTSLGKVEVPVSAFEKD